MVLCVVKLDSLEARGPGVVLLSSPATNPPGSECCIPVALNPPACRAVTLTLLSLEKGTPVAHRLMYAPVPRSKINLSCCGLPTSTRNPDASCSTAQHMVIPRVGLRLFSETDLVYRHLRARCWLFAALWGASPGGGLIRGGRLTCSLRTSGEPEPSVVMRSAPSGTGALSEYTHGDERVAACAVAATAKPTNNMNGVLAAIYQPHGT